MPQDSLDGQGKGKIVPRKCLALAALPPRSLSCLAPQEQRAPCAWPQLESSRSPTGFVPCSLPELEQGPEPQVPVGTAVSPLASPLLDDPLGVEWSWGKPSSLTPCGVEPTEEAVIWDPAETSTLLLPPRGPGGLGGTVNLILSIGKKGEKKKVQPAGSGEQPGEEALRTVCGDGGRLRQNHG